MRQILLAKRGGIVYKYSTRLNFFAMKHVALSLLAAACGALSASALDASNARIWLSEKIKPEFASAGSGIAAEKLGTAPTYARSWQYLSIPLHVEGVAKGEDTHPHFIPELKVRISLAMATADAKGKLTDSPELLTKEITYVDIPLVKSRKEGVGEGIVNVGVFVSPSNAFKLSAKDGDLTKKLVAVAVEGEFKGSNCNRVKEKPNDSVATNVVLDKTSALGKKLADSTTWWKKDGNGSIALASIAETPFAADYARYGYPPIKVMYGSAAAPVAAPAVSTTPADSSTGGPVGGPVTTGETPSYTPDSTTEGDSTATESDSSTSKKGKKGRKSRR